ncbi:MAG: porin [Planctomycetota bacterium]
MFRLNVDGVDQCVFKLIRLTLFALVCISGVQAESSDEFEMLELPAEQPAIALDQELAQLRAEIEALKQMQAASAPIISEQIFCVHEPPATRKKFPTARITGFFQADAVWFQQDVANEAAVGEIPDGADFRRARLAAVGEAWDNVSYILEMDFAFPGRPSFMDLWFEIDEVLGNNKLRVGLFRQPFGMEGLTSVKELTFLERSLPFAQLPFRQIGVMLHGHRADQLMTWAISGYRFPTDAFGGSLGHAAGYGMSSRLTGLLLDNQSSGSLIHLGAAYSYVNPDDEPIQIRSQPEVFVAETGLGVPSGAASSVPPFVDTGILSSADANLFSIELAGSIGSFYTQSEIIYSSISRPDEPSLVFPGFYTYAGYFLTGEKRKYNRKGGVFSRVKPKRSVGAERGIGAWEIAFRWSQLDLNDADVRGGRLNNLTTGLNWYVNPYTKFQWNYIHSILDDSTGVESEADIFAMRAQVDF